MTLQENQKLVGVGYFGDYDTDTNKFSSISATANTAKRMVTLSGNNITVSDLSINYENKADVGVSAIYVMGQSGKGYESFLHNLDVVANFSDSSTQTKDAIEISYASAIVSGSLNIRTTGPAVNGMELVSNQAFLDIQSDARVNIQTDGQNNAGIKSRGANINIFNGADVNIQCEKEGSGVFAAGSSVNIYEGVNLRIKNKAYGLLIESGTVLNVEGNLYLEADKQSITNNRQGDGSTINIASSAQVYTTSMIVNGAASAQGNNVINITSGAKLAFEKDGKPSWYEVKDDWNDKNTSTITNNTISADNVKDELNLESTSAWELPVAVDFTDGNSNGETTKQDLTDAGKNYQEIINQYDSLIKDASYKGINLLQADKLTVKFNETNTADLSVQGKDMSAQALGFKTFDWQTQADIADSLAEVANALQSIRNYSSELGNNYSIITTRQDFTESLINVLTEGADKLTLADMNEESANMLALQTRQQLAINSLSLAS